MSNNIERKLAAIMFTDIAGFTALSSKDENKALQLLNEQKQIINLNRVEVFERVRDLRFNNKKLYLFMEDTASIGVINLN